MEDVIVIEVKLTKVLTVEDLLPIVNKIGEVPNEVGWNHLFVVSGRMPIWVYAAATHRLHPAKAVAVFDPRLNMAVVVESHDPSYMEGETLPIDEDTKKILVEY